MNNTIQPSTNVNAYATSVYLLAPNPSNGGGIADNVMWQTINSGVDAFNNFSTPLTTTTGSAGFYHGIIAFNFSNPAIWNLNLNSCPNNLKDLYATGLHEITHALGFASLIDQNGQSHLGSNYPYYSRYDTFLQTTNGINLITNTSSNCGNMYNYTFNSPTLSTSIISGIPSTCQIKFAGSVNQIVYSSNPFSGGSSLSHFEDLCHSPNTYSENSYYLMSKSSLNMITGGFYLKKYPKDEERIVLCNLGYRVNNVFGSTNANNLYTYQGQTICGGNPTYATIYGGSQVVGVNDGITQNSTGNTYTYVINNNNLNPLTISNFLLNDYNPFPFSPQLFTYECAESVYNYGTVASINPTTITYLPNGTGTGVDLIRYVPIINGQRGNITYIYVYNSSPSCGTIGACESYVNNGNFEQFTSCGPITDQNSNYIQRPCWNLFSDTPDIWSIQNSLCPSGMYSFPQTNVNSYNGLNSNTHFLGLYSYKNHNNDGMQNSLLSPLIPNSAYYIKFKAKVDNSLGMNYPSKLVFGGSNAPIIASSSYYTSLPLQMQSLGSISISSNTWQDYQIYIPNNLITQNINYLTVLNGIYLSPSTQSYILIDDISIVEENNNIYFNPPSLVCDPNQIINLNNWTNAPNAIFSGNGVNGSSFNPNLVAYGSNNVITCSYTLPNGCYYELISTISYNIVTPTFTSVAPICPNTILSPLPTTSNNGITGSWSPILNNNISTNYTFTPNLGQCASSTNLTIEVQSAACCVPSYYSVNTPSNASALSSIPIGQTIQINADITIDGNFTIQNCTLRMAPNVKIIINSLCSLELNNCLLFACNGMWQGIEVKNKGGLKLNSTRIEDAINAVYSVENGTVTVVNSIFNKNLISLNFQNYLNFSGVSGSTFSCTSSNSPTFYAFLKAPYSNQKSNYGVYLDNNNVSLGSTISNNFSNLEVGIFAKNTASLIIQGSNFSTMNTICPVTNACTSATIKGWGVYADGVGNLTIGNTTNSALGNNFLNSYNGISLNNVQGFTIANNSFNNIKTPPIQNGMALLDWSTAFCISIKGNTGGTLSSNAIQNNTFTNFENGLFYNNNLSNNLTINNNSWSSYNSIDATAINILDNPVQPISITNNVFNSLSSQTGVNAIKVENLNVSSGQSLTISQNTIRNSYRGIWVSNYNSPQIVNHRSNLFSIGSTFAGIYFPATLNGTQTVPNVGIQINNCPNATISNNSVQRTNYTATAPLPLAANQFDFQFGISVGNSCTGTQVSNNVVSLLGTGIYAYGNTPVTLQCNNMVNNSTGLWINSLIGQQGTFNAPQDNTWTIPIGYVGVRRAGNPNPSNSPIFFTRSMFNPSLPITSAQFMPNPNSIQMNPTVAISPQISLSSSPNNCFITGNPTNGLMQVINEVGEYSYLSEEELKSLDVDLYKTLKIIPDYYDESTIDGQKIQEFMDSIELTNTAKIYEYEEKLAQKDTIGAKELMALFDAFSDVEQTYKRVYEIYNRSLLEGKNYFSKDDSLLLNEIAYLSPRVAGNAVYTARVLLGLTIIDTETYAAKSAKLQTSNSSSYLKIFPNPSNDYFHYYLPLGEKDKGTIIISEISGKEIQKWTADYTTNQGSLDIQKYAKGIYIFELSINGNQKLIQKLIIK